jgi:hypothetical protein
MHSIRSSHDFRSAKPLRFALGWRPVPSDWGHAGLVPKARPTEAYLPRFRALALFGRRPPERVVRSSLPASENLHRSRHPLGLPVNCEVGHRFPVLVQITDRVGAGLV